MREDLALFGELLDSDLGVPAEGELAVAVRAAERQLSEAIRSGALDGRLDQLSARLREHVERKLEVARPGYTGDSGN